MWKSIALVLSLILVMQASLAAGTDAADGEAASTTTAAASSPDKSRWRLGVALGYGLRTNPLLQSDDIPIIADIDIAWFGDHFFFDNGDLGLTFVDNTAVTVSAMGRFNSDQVFFSKTDTEFVQIGATGEPLMSSTELKIPDRDYAIEMGFELLADGRWGGLQTSAYHDVSGTHDGYEIDVEYRYGWRHQRLYVEPALGVVYKSEKMNDYYWGVRPGESSAALPEYQAGDGINVRGRLALSYQMTRNWAFSLSANYERLNDEAAASPIVEERDVFGYFAGFSYRYR